MHDLLVGKLQAYGFDNDSLNFICNYLLDREQRIKINSSFSTWSKIKNGVPQGSILELLLFNINTLDMLFEQKDVNSAAYADDTTPYFCDKNLEVLLSKLQIYALKLLEWFSNNYMKMNSYKCHFLLSSSDENKKTELKGEVVSNTQVEKLLGVHIDYKLKFDTHIETFYKKAGKKLYALARIIKCMSTNQAQLLMRSFIMSQFSYCPLVWMCRQKN